MNSMLSGAILMACLVIGLFFFRFWRSTGDRFFLYFALSFWIEGVNQMAWFAPNDAEGYSPMHYMLRILAYALIAIAILRKNRKRKEAATPPALRPSPAEPSAKSKR